MNVSTEIQPPQLPLSATIARLAGVVGATHYPTKDRAILKRWSPGQPIPLAFYRLWLRHIGQELPLEVQTEEWMVLSWGLATMGLSGHQPKRSFGQALAESHYAESRVERLLSAPGDIRHELFMSTIRFLAARGESFNWTEAATFLLAKENTQLRERICRQIAQAYYRHLPKD